MNNHNTQCLPAQKMMIIPGNPPASYFYEAWKKELQDITKLEVLIHYYPSFHNISCSSTYLKKVEHFYLEYLKHHVKNHEEIILIGHSIGGHIALKLLEQYPEKIKRCVLLFPFLHSPGPKGKLFLELSHQINKHLFFKTKLFKLLKPLGFIYKDLQKLKPHEINSSLDFAFHEHKTIGRKKNIIINPLLNPKISLYYTTKDTWCRTHVVTNLHPEIHTELININHNFVVFPEQRKIINRRLFTN